MKRTVTVIDDDVDLRNLLQMALRYDGYDVTVYSSGPDFLEAFKKSVVSDFYIIDINLGGITGAELCQKIKATEITRSAHVILISANPEVEQLAKESNANDFMLKPFSQKDLLVKIRSIR